MRRALFALVLVAAGCHDAPPPRDRILFAHGPHLREGMSCARCHAGAARDEGEIPADAASPSARRPLLPDEASCRSCHDDPVRDRCSRCHTVPARAAPYADATDDIRFDHEDHDDPEGGRCVRCHGGEGRTLATFEPATPSMDTCTSSCHADDMRAMACARCHEDLHRYRLEDVAIVDHGPGFLRRHGVASRTDAALCTQCHEPTFCEECHLTAQGAPLEVFDPDRVYRDFVHRGDFTARHGIEAGLERGTCARCHGVSFCDGCHTAAGIGGSVAPGSPHPPGWLDPLSPTGHAREARRDLLSCVSCHEADAERTCVPCHRVGGVAGNPHPPGFGGGMDPLLHGVCRACHAP